MHGLPKWWLSAYCGGAELLGGWAGKHGLEPGVKWGSLEGNLLPKSVNEFEWEVAAYI